VLAAGLGSRYRSAGGAEPTKLVADYRGEPLVRWAVRAALASKARPIIVVTGHAREQVAAALAGLDVRFVHNRRFALGLASSLKAGVAALPGEVAGAVIGLGDMPEASAAVIDALIDGFLAKPGAQAAVPVRRGQRGNPVLLGRALFDAVAGLSGDEGARGLLRALPPEAIATIEVADDGVRLDVDTPQDLAPGFQVRDARPDDQSNILAAIAELQDFERKLHDSRLPGADVAAAYYERLAAKAQGSGAMLVAECDGVFAGFVVGWIEQADEICETPDSTQFGYVSDISVLEAFRGKGAAGALLAALEARLVAYGVTRLRLNFLSANHAAQSAYEKAGYAPYEVIYEKRVGSA
jgi:molybdenum cofactor cytidylyltransferase